MSNKTTLAQAIKWLADALADTGIDNPMRDARLIASHALKIPMHRLTVSMQDELDQADVQILRDVSHARLERRPLSHVLGHRSFFKHEFHVGPDVLDPRPETETLVVAALGKPFNRVLDLGVGSGAILLSLLAEQETAYGVGTDISSSALRYAQRNADRLGVAERCEFVHSDWFENVSGSYDMIVSNPPYIAADEMEGLSPELGFEPRIALTDEADGLSAYRILIANAGQYLQSGGHLIVEIGPTQGAEVARMFAKAGFKNVHILLDLDRRDRIVEGVWQVEQDTKICQKPGK